MSRSDHLRLETSIPRFYSVQLETILLGCPPDGGVDGEAEDDEEEDVEDAEDGHATVFRTLRT